MATLPHGAVPIIAAETMAPGFSMENVHVMAGVPRIMRGDVRGAGPEPAGRRADPLAHRACGLCLRRPDRRRARGHPGEVSRPRPRQLSLLPRQGRRRRAGGQGHRCGGGRPAAAECMFALLAGFGTAACRASRRRRAEPPLKLLATNRASRTAVWPGMLRRLGITSRQSSCGVRISVSPSSAISVFRCGTTSPPRKGREEGEAGCPRRDRAGHLGQPRGRRGSGGGRPAAAGSPRMEAPAARSSAAPVDLHGGDGLRLPMRAGFHQHRGARACRVAKGAWSISRRPG